MSVRARGAVLGLVCLLILAGCGAASSTAAGNATSTSNSGGGGYGYGGVGATSTPSTASTSGAAAITTKTVAVSGKQETVLADAKGMTLYYFTPDTATSIACTGGCQQIWPPLLSSGTPTGTGLSGKLTLIKTSAGEQVSYNGHPLYTYAGDNSANDANGQGINGKWYVATPSLTANGG